MFTKEEKIKLKEIANADEELYISYWNFEKEVFRLLEEKGMFFDDVNIQKSFRNFRDGMKLNLKLSEIKPEIDSDDEYDNEVDNKLAFESSLS